MGMLNGKRQTKDFKTEMEALKLKAKWDAEIQRKNLGALQDLAAVNKREILLALERLAPFNASILDVADFYIRYAMPAKGPVTIEDYQLLLFYYEKPGLPFPPSKMEEGVRAAVFEAWNRYNGCPLARVANKLKQCTFNAVSIEYLVSLLPQSG